MFGLESMVKSMLESSGIDIEQTVNEGRETVARCMALLDGIDVKLGEIERKTDLIDLRLLALSTTMGVTSMSEMLVEPPTNDELFIKKVGKPKLTEGHEDD